MINTRGELHRWTESPPNTFQGYSHNDPMGTENGKFITIVATSVIRHHNDVVIQVGNQAWWLWGVQKRKPQGGLFEG